MKPGAGKCEANSQRARSDDVPEILQGTAELNGEWSVYLPIYQGRANIPSHKQR